MIFRARSFQFQFPRPALIMGIVNVTPDSFSDGGMCVDPDTAVTHALRLIDEGADILDIGGESTRPRATPVAQDEELRRIVPVIQRLASRVKVPLSIDTMKPEVARIAIDNGASIINDVAANRDDDSMWNLARESGAGYICMHMQGTPRTMQQNPSYGDLVAEISAFFEKKLSRARECGVEGEQLVFDVGIGFGKTVEHNLKLLQDLSRFTKWQRPLLIGVSRKSFIGTLSGGATEERLPGSIACACWAVQNGVQMVRTHDVAVTRQAVRMTEQLMRKLM